MFVAACKFVCGISQVQIRHGTGNSGALQLSDLDGTWLVRGFPTHLRIYVKNECQIVPGGLAARLTAIIEGSQC